MKNKILVCIIICVLFSSISYLGYTKICYGASQNVQQQCALKTAMRKLWAEHVIWTRDYIITAIAGLPNVKLVAERLLKNQDDIGNAIVPYYGSKAGAKLTALLKDHILIAAQLIDAAIKKDDTKFNEENKKWFENAKEIAVFLSSANPNWPENALVSMLNDHLTLTTNEVKARLGKKWSEDIVTFGKIFDQAMNLADSLTEGIMKQFPGKFNQK